MSFPSSTGAERSGKTRHVHLPYPHHAPEGPVAQSGLHQTTANDGRYHASVAHPSSTPQMSTRQPILLADASFLSSGSSFSQETLHHASSPFNGSHSHPLNSFAPQAHYTPPSGIDSARTYFVDQLINQVKIDSSAKRQLLHEVANVSSLPLLFLSSNDHPYIFLAESGGQTSHCSLGTLYGYTRRGRRSGQQGSRAESNA